MIAHPVKALLAHPPDVGENPIQVCVHDELAQLKIPVLMSHEMDILGVALSPAVRYFGWSGLSLASQKILIGRGI